MPNLENLRKQAKQILRWHRDRYYPVAARIRAALPRYRQLSDPEIPAANFKLGDAQEIVARQHGFTSWQALKRGIETVTSEVPIASKPVLLSAEPQLFVSDIAVSCDFFAAKLGFGIIFRYGEPPFYAQVSRDGATLNLRHTDAPLMDGARRHRDDLHHGQRRQGALSRIPRGRRSLPPAA